MRSTNEKSFFLKKKMTKPLSEGISLLNLGHNSPGLPIHKAHRDEFITIKLGKAQCLEDDVVMVEDVERTLQNYVRITIGEATFALIFKEKEGILAEDLPVYAGEEVWVSCSTPKRFVMFGTTHRVRN